MADKQEPQQPRAGAPMQKVISLKEDGFYSNCTMVETTPFDISVLFGKVRPRIDEQGNRTLVEVYEKQIYLSHLQARALHEALGRSLASLSSQRMETPPPDKQQ